MPLPITYADALQRIAALPSLRRIQSHTLDTALDQVLAKDVALDRDQPPFDRATMDGFAVMLDGDRSGFRIVGAISAGQHFARELRPGEAIRITTGSPAPAGTTVIPIECTNLKDHAPVDSTLSHRSDHNIPVRVVVTDPQTLVPRRNIAWRGEDGHAGDRLLAAGTQLTPTTMAVAAMAGAHTVSCFAKPAVALITTGDEVGGAGSAGIADSNGPFLLGFLRSLGLAMSREHVADDPIVLRAALVGACEKSDVLVTTGGVGGSEKDLIPVLAPSLGFDVVFHHVAMQPGKPVFVAKRGDGRLWVGLPGNPVSVVATAHLVLLPILHRLMGLQAAVPWQSLPLAAPWSGRNKRQSFLPAKVIDGAVHVVPWNGSGDLIAAAAADGLVDLPAETPFSAGTAVRFLPYVGGHPGHRGLIPPRSR
jgi:molybdopterin molybdotransferase